MKMKTSKGIALKYNMKNLMTKLLPIVKKIVNKKVYKIKSRVMNKIRSIIGVGFNKKVSNNRKIKSLENNLSVEATKNIINIPKIAFEKSPIVAKPNVVTPIKIASKLKIVDKPKVVDKPKIAIEKNNSQNKYKTRVIKQLKKHFKKLIDDKKCKYLDYHDDEYKGIKDLEHCLKKLMKMIIINQY